MALYPFAEHKLLPENNNQPRIDPRAVILHSAGGHTELYNWWQSDSSRGLESHFFIADAQTKGYKDGDVVQYMDTNIRADANGQANGYAISIETASTTHAAEGWSPAQMKSLIKLVDWLCQTHPKISRKGMTTPTGSGIAWHVQFGAPGPWTPSRGKVCPGPERIKQVQREIIPAVAKGGAGTPTGELTMADIDKILKRLDAQDKILATLKEDYLTTGKGVRQVIVEVDKRTEDIASGKRP